MAKEPADRFSDSEEMRAALNGSETAAAVDFAPPAAALEPTVVMPPGGYHRTRPPACRPSDPEEHP